MGTFCTTTTLDTVMVGTTFDTVTTNVATECIVWAEEEIRKKLSKRYDMSSSQFQSAASTPPIIQTISKWLSLGYTYEQLSRGGKESMTRADRLIARGMKDLDLIAEYKLDVVNSAGAALTDISTGAYSIRSNTDDYAETFNEDDPLNWKISNSKLDNISSERLE